MKSDDPRAPLLAAIAAIAFVGVGLTITGPLISLRLEGAGFSGWANGASMALAGLASILSSLATPALTRRFGLRALTLSAIGGLIGCLLAMARTQNPWLWFPLRFIFSAGVGFLFVISEYAIGAMAPPNRRGFWFGLYATCLGLGFFIGPAALAFWGDEGSVPFYFAMACVVFAGAPLALYSDAIPSLVGRERANIRDSLKKAPILMAAAFVFGATETGTLALLPIYAVRNGYDAQTSMIFVAAIAAGNVAFQMPLGLIGDAMNRMRLLSLICVIGAAGAFAAPFFAPYSTMFGPLLFVWGGVISALYTIALGELSGRLDGPDLAAANSAFVMLYACGMMAGPPFLGIALDLSVRYGLFIALAAIFLAYASALLMRTRSVPP